MAWKNEAHRSRPPAVPRSTEAAVPMARALPLAMAERLVRRVLILSKTARMNLPLTRASRTVQK